MATPAAAIPTAPSSPAAIDRTRRGINRNILILGSVILLVLGGLAFFLVSRGGNIFNSEQKITKQIINNSYFQNLVASGATTKSDLEAISIIRPYQDGFLGISKENFNWEGAQTLAERTGARIPGVDDDTATRRALLDAILFSFPDHATVPLWASSEGMARVLTGNSIHIPEFPDDLSPRLRHRVLLQWSTMGNPTPNQLTLQEKAEGFMLLFDGKSLDGWRTRNEPTARAGWQVVDGTIMLVQPGGGDLITKGRFGDIDLRLEFKVSSGANSGIFWHLQENAEASHQYAPEYQIIDPAMLGDASQDSQRARLTGALYDLFPSKMEWSKAIGEWNEARIVAHGTNVELYLNGHLTVRTDSAGVEWMQRISKSKFAGLPQFNRSRDGHICLQDHGGAVAFRTIRIRCIPQTPGLASPAAPNTPQRSAAHSEHNPLDHPDTLPSQDDQ
jgi:hypothetical protein